MAPPHYIIQIIRIKVVRNSVSLVFGMLVWHLRMLSQRLQWRCKRSVWGSHLLRETKLWWPISKKVKKTKVLYVFLKFKKCWHNLSMKWCNRLSFINYLFRYISIPLKLKGIKFYNFARPIKRTVMSLWLLECEPRGNVSNSSDKPSIFSCLFCYIERW